MHDRPVSRGPVPPPPRSKSFSLHGLTPRAKRPLHYPMRFPLMEAIKQLQTKEGRQCRI
jgi:hypothetical protein